MSEETEKVNTSTIASTVENATRQSAEAVTSSGVGTASADSKAVGVDNTVNGQSLLNFPASTLG